MNMFDTNVQYLKYRALREVAMAAFKDELDEVIYEGPKKVLPGPKATTRCCIYKERAIFTERIRLAMGKNTEENEDNIINVISIACDECPASGYNVTDSCRGCIAHRCEQACKVDAIKFDKNQHAYIDKSKCVNCGACSRACQFSAIINKIRPCENACKLKAISMGSEHAATIDRDKCISCGACVYQCPFGAIVDKSFITNVIDMIKKSNNNTNYKVYAIVAPSISSQFIPATLGQVITGIKELGFHTVIETALGADMVALKETDELVEKKFLTSSCCPAFVQYINKQFPSLANNISSNYSPMVELAKYLKSIDTSSKVIFVGPCTAKKTEFQKDNAKDYVDSVITFEELKALFDSKEIQLNILPETRLDNASYYGRIFARSGGLTDAVNEALKETGKDKEFTINPIVCNGIEECKMALLRKSKNVLPNNFIEGMACVGGCIGGPCAISHGPKDLSQVDKYGKEAKEKTIINATSILKETL